MKRILVATDFSTRSDRALRRATLLAQQSGARLLLVHAVDDDQPRQLLEAERQAAGTLLHHLAATVRDADRVECDAKLAEGDPFQAIVELAEDADADLIVMGPHRRRVLRDAFVGTTVERTIRRSHRPVIMANAVPVRPYDRILLATDCSEYSALAMEAARGLGLLQHAEIVVLHAFDALAERFSFSTSMTEEQRRSQLAGEEHRAAIELGEFLGRLQFGPSRRLVRPIAGSAARAILDCALEQRSDLVVMGTRGRSGVAKVLLGSVAEEVLRDAEQDVLAVPPAGNGVPPEAR